MCIVNEQIQVGHDVRDVTHCNILHHTSRLGLTNAHSKLMFKFSAELLWVKRLQVSPDLQIKEHTLGSGLNSVISEAAPALRSAQVNGLAICPRLTVLTSSKSLQKLPELQELLC